MPYRCTVFTSTEMNDVCPISHIPVDEIQHPVTFVSEHRIVYNAEDVIDWLKHHSLINPITNAQVSPDFANNLLRPFDRNDSDTPLVLSRAGYLDGAGGKVFIPRHVVFVPNVKRCSFADSQCSCSVVEEHFGSEDVDELVWMHRGFWGLHSLPPF